MCRTPSIMLMPQCGVLSSGLQFTRSCQCLSRGSSTKMVEIDPRCWGSLLNTNHLIGLMGGQLQATRARLEVQKL